jgi:hypothetical protein
MMIVVREVHRIECYCFLALLMFFRSALFFVVFVILFVIYATEKKKSHQAANGAGLPG